MAVVVPAMTPLTVGPRYTRNPSWNCGVLAGQITVVCRCWASHGVVAERAAALKWSQARSFCRLSSITVPSAPAGQSAP